MMDSEVVSSNGRKQMIKLYLHLTDAQKHKVFIFLHKELSFT